MRRMGYTRRKRVVLRAVALVPFFLELGLDPFPDSVSESWGREKAPIINVNDTSQQYEYQQYQQLRGYKNVY